MEKTGKMRKFTEVDFLRRKSGALATRCNLPGCKPEKHHNSREKENPEAIENQCFRESKWRDSASRRNLNRRDCPLGSSLVSVEKAADDISATGSHRRLSPRPFQGLRSSKSQPRRHSKTGGPARGHPGFAVEVAGFEPAAFWSRTKRATKLRYTSMLEPMRGLEPLTC